MSNGLISKAKAKKLLGVGNVGLKKMTDAGTIVMAGNKVARAGIERILGRTIEEYEARQSGGDGQMPATTPPAEKSGVLASPYLVCRKAY